MVLPANDVGLVKVGTVLPSNVLVDLLTKHVTLHSDQQQPGPAGNDGVLVIHEKYQYHKDTVLMGKSFLSQCNDTTLRIDNILDHQSQELADSN